MTFYLCMTGIHIQLTSEQGKDASLKLGALKATFEDGEAEMGRCKE